MDHYVQYHNIDSMGLDVPDPRVGVFEVWSNKNVKELNNAIGQTVWLISGEKKSRGRNSFLSMLLLSAVSRVQA